MAAMPSLCADAGVNLLDHFAVDFDRSGVGLMGAGDDLDQRRFACAIFAEQRVDFAGVRVERHSFQRADGVERLW